MTTHFKRVFQFDLNGVLINEWESIKEASISTETPDESISNCCHFKQKTASGYIWSFDKDIDVAKYRHNPTKPKLKIPVVQLDIDRNFIREWDSAQSVMFELGINKGSVGKVCMGKAMSAGGFVFMYKKDYLEMLNCAEKGIC